VRAVRGSYELVEDRLLPYPGSQRTLDLCHARVYRRVLSPPVVIAGQLDDFTGGGPR
jgi:hypothetical protein